jgi:hypothetical protein
VLRFSDFGIDVGNVFTDLLHIDPCHRMPTFCVRDLGLATLGDFARGHARAIRLQLIALESDNLIHQILRFLRHPV